MADDGKCGDSDGKVLRSTARMLPFSNSTDTGIRFLFGDDEYI